MTGVTFSFAQTVDVVSAAAAFRDRGRTRIERALEPAAADALHDCLVKEVPWKLAFNEGPQARVIAASDLRRFSSQQTASLSGAIVEGARRGFQYAYWSYPMVTARVNGDDPGLLLHPFLDWLNGAWTLETLRQVTGIDTLRKCDAQATYYQPGHFLTLHDDGAKGTERRRVGYVLNLSRDWRADWGGLLQFLADEGRTVLDTWVPTFNSLVLFRVPVLHAVSFVAPFATQPRLAITGWFRDA
jgi:Rps23 Pro-64 3,4-dihydroxylase Tpa1-like proline 4-hydroxylase